jgi:tetratricopeptide (TPR) repeat protein
VAEKLGDEATALRGRLRRVWLGLLRGGTQTEAVGPLEAVLADAERIGDERLAAETLWRLGVLSTWVGENERGEQLLRSAVARARSAGDAHVAAQAVHWLALELFWGPAPVDGALEECRRFGDAMELNETARLELLVIEGAFLALRRDFEQARQLASQGRLGLLELGQKVQYAAVAMLAAIVEFLADDASAAERILREAREILSAAGERGFLSTVSALLALALVKQGRHGEADVFADESRRVGAEDDVITQIYWRIAKAHVVAVRGEVDEAARLAAETLDLTTNYGYFDTPNAIVEVASFLDPDAARAALERAHEGAVAKGNVVTAERARAMLAALP